MAETENVARQREWPGTVVVGILLAGSGVLHLLVDAALPGSRAVGAGYPPYLLLAAAVEGACVLGLFLRKRWCIVAYGSFFPFHQLAVLTASTWNPLSLGIRLGALVAMIGSRRHLD